jgi:hypothetical protein
MRKHDIIIELTKTTDALALDAPRTALQILRQLVATLEEDRRQKHKQKGKAVPEDNQQFRAAVRRHRTAQRARKNQESAPV